MAIIRSPRPKSNFYVLDKKISEDKGLSWGARGMLVFLLGKSDHWSVSIAALINETELSARKSGRDVVYAILDELIVAGYVNRQQLSEAGKFGGVDYLVSECRTTPLTALPLTDKPHTDNQPLVSIEFKQELTLTKKKKEVCAKPTFNMTEGRFYDLPLERLDQWLEAYPAVDVGAEIKKAAAWLTSNPKNIKSDYVRFLNGWLSRAQDKAPTINAYAPNGYRPSQPPRNVQEIRAQTASDMLGMFYTQPHQENSSERRIIDVQAS